MTRTPKLPALLLRLRQYAGDRVVVAWLERVDGPAHSGLLHGELLPGAAEELAAAFLALGVPVEREGSGTVGAVPEEGWVVEAEAHLADLFAGQEPEPARPEPEPVDRVRPARRKRKKGEGI